MQREPQRNLKCCKQERTESALEKWWFWRVRRHAHVSDTQKETLSRADAGLLFVGLQFSSPLEEGPGVFVSSQEAEEEASHLGSSLPLLSNHGPSAYLAADKGVLLDS